jgi:hypothetical protein
MPARSLIEVLFENPTQPIRAFLCIYASPQHL